MLVALAAQLPLLGLSALLEFSRRKARRSAEETSPPPELDAAPASLEKSPTAIPADVQFKEPALEREEAEPPSAIGEGEAATPDIVADGGVAAEEPTPPEAITPLPSSAQTETPLAPAPKTPQAASTPARKQVRMGLGLRRTRENFLARLRAAITGAAKIDEIYEGLEEALIGADVGVETSLKLVEQLRTRLKNDARPEAIREALKDEIERLLLAVERPFADSGEAPLVIIMVGVNGVGKTTTVAKLAAILKEEGSVIVAAADTFRAAAIEQLEVWCERVGVELIKQKAGSDPAAVAFDAVKAAIARKASAVIVDTAGRLQTKVNLMEELKKIARVVGRELPGAPHETWLVLDATTGQNALSQAKIFGETTPLTGVVLAKLDGTAKGGVIVAIADRLQLPVRFVGLGEELEDLRPFEAHEFVNALFSDAEEGRDAASSPYAA
jgi:fused signal recognition particle receptor